VLVHERPVGGAEILDDQSVPIGVKLQMPSREFGIVDHDIRLIATENELAIDLDLLPRTRSLDYT
jgi:hypothetical protein